jgi:hypothetical protein
MTRWLRTENLEADYAKQVQGDGYGLTRAEGRGSLLRPAQRAKREWQLTNPFTDYAGNYTNDLLGTIEVVAKEKALAVRMGSLNTVATPFTQKDTIRVVMLPGGNGEVMGFVKDTEGKVVSLNFGGATFTRVVK